jgi:hypothetical protein
MNKPKFTPGPWAAAKPLEEYHEFEPAIGRHLENGEWETVAWARLAPAHGNTDANAALIALAPDLYERGTELAQAVLDTWANLSNPSEYHAANTRARTLARAFLDAAEPKERT